MVRRAALNLLSRVTTLKPIPAGELRSLCAGIDDWQEVYDVATDHGLHGLLYYHCKHVRLDAAPLERTLEMLRGAYYFTTARNMQLMHVLAEVGRVAAEAQCRLMPIQGSLLQGTYYGDAGLRPMEDLDLLLTPGSYERFGRALEACGFEHVAPGSAAWIRGSVVLDVHRHVVNVERISSRAALWGFNATHLWERGHLRHGYSDSLRFLSASDAILALTAHALKHGFERLIWAADLRIVLEHHLAPRMGGETMLFWPRLMETTRALGGDRALCYLLHILRLGLRMSLPGDAHGWLDAQLSLDRVERRFVLSVCRFQPLPRLGDIMLAYPPASEGASEGASHWRRMQLLLEICFPHPMVLAENFPWLPRPLLALAYPLRIFQLLGFAILTLGRLLRG